MYIFWSIATRGMKNGPKFSSYKDTILRQYFYLFEKSITTELIYAPKSI